MAFSVKQSNDNLPKATDLLRGKAASGGKSGRFSSTADCCSTPMAFGRG